MEVSQILHFCHIFIVLSVITKCLGCPGKHFPNSIAERVVSSDVIIWGEIVTKTVDHSRSSGTDVAYSAEVRVRCVLKGRVPSRILVDDVGNVPNKCLAIDFIENVQYIMLLRVDRQGRYVPTFDQELFSQSVFDRIYGYCGINVSQPEEEAEKESSYVDCPNMLSRRAVNRKEGGRCTPIDRVERWELAGPQPPRVTIVPVINARTRELDRPTRRPGRRKGKDRQQQQYDDMDVSRNDREQGGTPADTSKHTDKRRYPAAYPTQSVVAIIYERSEPRMNKAATISTQAVAKLLMLSCIVLYSQRL